MVGVLTYYRTEWTDVSDKDREYKVLVSDQIQDLIFECFKSGYNIQNAASEVKQFFNLVENFERPTGIKDTES